MAKTEYFWTDSQQAGERLHQTVILYDGQPHYVERIDSEHDFDDRIPRANLRPCDPTSPKTSRKQLNSPKFGRFRTMPNLGWMNSTQSGVGAVYLERRNLRATKHGLCTNNVTVHNFRFRDDWCGCETGAYNFSGFMFDKGFVDAHNGVFPSLERTLQNIRESTVIAYSRQFAVARCELGIRWLFRGTDKVGIFTGTDTLNLLAKFSFLREEIMADPAFTLNTIREF